MRGGTRKRLRIAVAKRAGCLTEGTCVPSACAYCGCTVYVSWPVGEEPTFTYVLIRGGYGFAGRATAHLDHVVPEWANGPTSLDNTVIACAPCNLAKGASAFGDPEFLEWLRGRRVQITESYDVWRAALPAYLATLGESV